jgi:hypothetical protein
MVPVGKSSEAGSIRSLKENPAEAGLRLMIVHKSRIARVHKVATVPLVAANAVYSSL